MTTSALPSWFYLSRLIYNDLLDTSAPSDTWNGMLIDAEMVANAVFLTPYEGCETYSLGDVVTIESKDIALSRLTCATSCCLCPEETLLRAGSKERFEGMFRAELAQASISTLFSLLKFLGRRIDGAYMEVANGADHLLFCSAPLDTSGFQKWGIVPVGTYRVGRLYVTVCVRQEHWDLYLDLGVLWGAWKWNPESQTAGYWPAK